MLRETLLALCAAAAAADEATCGLVVNVDGADHAFRTRAPPPPRADIVAAALDFAAAHPSLAGAGCDGAPCVAARIADHVLAACAEKYARRLRTGEATVKCATLAGAVAASPARWAAALGEFEGRLAQFLVADGAGPLQKAQLRYHHLAAAERAAGRRYAVVVRHRPDLLWVRDVPRSLVAAEGVRHCLDVVAFCGRGDVDGFPCDVPHARESVAVGPRGVASVAGCAPELQFTIVRPLAAQDRAERHLFRFYHWASQLAALVDGGLPDAVAECALDFLALSCRAYDAFLGDWAREAAVAADGTVRASALAARRRQRDLFDAVAAADAAAAKRALDALVRLYERELGVCAPRRDCAADARARSLCARSFKDDVLAAPIHGRFPYVGSFCAG
ncbi:hypothetical protein JL722_1773 [Aureococcus anophagefferens]|nr:hypothetical protein JL722_1773 [Aureococcus anophagefferens]